MARRPTDKTGSGSKRGRPVPHERGSEVRARRAQATNKIFPRNLTARAAYMVAGNPVITRLEDSVANCFPGLELDVRNLDRRFFPGLVFEFIENGARLAYIELYQDPDLKLEEKKDAASRLYQQLSKFQAKIDKDELDAMEKAKEHSIDPETIDLGSWFLDLIKENGKTIKVGNLDDVTVWRIVRGLEVDTVVEVGLRKYKDRAGFEPLSTTFKLKGWRRRFTDKETGVINGAYQPGELTQGLCSPWQHDFRDCACFYWAANHPDIVLGELDPGEAQADNTSASDPIVPLDWLRRDRARRREAEAFETIDKNRPHQLDHFEINRVWQDLNIVVEGREIGGLYVPATIDTANPFASPGELAQKLAVTLAPLEVALTFEYLYARLSVRSEDEVPPGNAMLRGAVALARNNLLLIAPARCYTCAGSIRSFAKLYDRKLIPDEDFTQPRSCAGAGAGRMDTAQHDDLHHAIAAGECRAAQAGAPRARQPVHPCGASRQHAAAGLVG